MVHSPNDALQSHKVSGQNSPRGRVGGQKSLKNPENLEKLSPGQGGGYWGGRPLGDMSTYLRHHRRDIAQIFMVDSPSESLQTHKVSGRNSPRGRVSGQKSLKNPENPEKLSPGQGGGYWGGRPLGDMSTYLRQHRRDIARIFMMDKNVQACPSAPWAWQPLGCPTPSRRPPPPPSPIQT
jgi:hypothetical protein